MFERVLKHAESINKHMVTYLPANMLSALAAISSMSGSEAKDEKKKWEVI